MKKNLTRFFIDPTYEKQALESIGEGYTLEGVYFLNCNDIRIWFRDKDGKLNSKLEPAQND